MIVKRRSYTADVELSVSRINRLLRPLRNKCAILASATSRPSGSAAPITYRSSSSTQLETRFPPPLDVLHDPKFAISRAHQESRSLDTLARQIYAVTNAYQNVVQAALPAAGGLDHDGSCRRNVLDLTDICAASVGRSIKGEVAASALEGESESDEAEEMALVDELYESVPVRFRSWTLVAHATSEIVDTCPNHHPMFMISLLGVALTHGLYAESKTFLRSFLTALIRSPRHGVLPPITNPIYPSYLVELCNEWTHLVPESRTAPFTHRSFAAVTLEVLAEHGSATAWTCKSITRFVQLLRTRDFECFLTFLHGLIQALAARPKRYLVHDREEARSLLARLAKWTGVITTDFFSVERCSSDATQTAHAHSESHQFYSIIEILASAHDAGLHLPTTTLLDNDDDDVEEDNNDTETRDPQAALVCAATHCLSTPLFTTLRPPHQHTILTLLHAIPTNPSLLTTFDALANRPVAHLRILAGALRAHDLGSLERALWASAIEHSEPECRGHRAAALVEAAKFGREEVDEVEVEVAGREEERIRLVGRSPPRKRARREMVLRQRASPSPSYSSSSSTSISVASTPSLSSAASSLSSSLSSSSVRSRSGSPVPGEIAGSSENDETSRRCRVVATRSCVELRSVLADALKTRKDLKVERRRASLRRLSVRGSLGKGYSRAAVPTPPPSEDDVLDMFAYDDPF